MSIVAPVRSEREAIPNLGPTPSRKTGSATHFTRLALGLLALGVCCRLFRFLLCFPVWGDEASVAVNLLERDYLGLTRQLDFNQVAPLLFLWSEKAVSLLLGSSELALRLLPFLASLASLWLFWHLTRRILDPLSMLCAVGLLALARWPVTMGSFIKPYSFDLLAALAFMVLAIHHLRQPDRPIWLILLTFLAPLALLFSYPAVFVAVGVSLALLPGLWRNSWRVRVWFLAFNAALAGAFLATYFLVGQQQLDPETGTVNSFMQNYWAHGFPPRQPVALLVWFAKIHTGRLMAYPVGDGNGASVVTFVLFLVGLMAFWRRRSWSLLLLCLVPFALNLVAAALRRYPYGGCCRLSQHLAPAICIFAGTGLATILRRFTILPSQRLRLASALTALLTLLGLGQLLVDAYQPYRDKETLWFACLARTLLAQAGPEDAIVLAQPRQQTEAMLRYHLGRHPRVGWGSERSPPPNHPATDVAGSQAERGRKTVFGSPLLLGEGLGEGFSSQTVNAQMGTLWYLDFWSDFDHRGDKAPDPEEPNLGLNWVVIERVCYSLPPTRPLDPSRRCIVYRFERKNTAHTDHKALPCWP